MWQQHKVISVSLQQILLWHLADSRTLADCRGLHTTGMITLNLGYMWHIYLSVLFTQPAWPHVPLSTPVPEGRTVLLWHHRCRPQTILLWLEGTEDCKTTGKRSKASLNIVFHMFVQHVIRGRGGTHLRLLVLCNHANPVHNKNSIPRQM